MLIRKKILAFIFSCAVVVAVVFRVAKADESGIYSSAQLIVGSSAISNGGQMSISDVKAGKLPLYAKVISSTGEIVRVSEWIVYLTDGQGNKITDGSIVLADPSESDNLYSALLGILKNGSYNGKVVIFWAQAKVNGEMTNKASFKVVLVDQVVSAAPQSAAQRMIPGFLGVTADANMPSTQMLSLDYANKFTILAAIFAVLAAIFFIPAFTWHSYDKPRTWGQKLARLCHRVSLLFLIIGTIIYIDGITNITDELYLFVGICYLILWTAWVYYWLNPKKSKEDTSPSRSAKTIPLFQKSA